MAQFLAVKNFEKFQHYKDRNPPWIKFHFSTLSDYAITSLSDAAQGQLFKFWLLASRHDNRIPNNPTWLRREIKANGPLKLKELLASGLLELREHDASGSLSLTRADAPSQEAEVEKEGETEKEKTTATAREVSPGRQMLIASLPEPSRRHAMTAAIAQYAQGMDLPPGSGIPTGKQLDSTALDVMATVGPGQVSPKLFRKFLLRTMRGEDDQPRTRSADNSLVGALLRGSVA